MPVKRHIHKYQYINIGRKDKPRMVYACALKDCTHFMPTLAMVVGKETICHQCNKPAVMTPDIVRKKRVKPRCFDCRTNDPRSIAKSKTENPVPAKKERSAIDMLLAMRGVSSED